MTFRPIFSFVRHGDAYTQILGPQGTMDDEEMREKQGERISAPNFRFPSSA